MYNSKNKHLTPPYKTEKSYVHIKEQIPHTALQKLKKLCTNQRTINTSQRPTKTKQLCTNQRTINTSHLPTKTERSCAQIKEQAPHTPLQKLKKAMYKSKNKHLTPPNKN